MTERWLECGIRVSRREAGGVRSLGRDGEKGTVTSSLLFREVERVNYS